MKDLNEPQRHSRKGLKRFECASMPFREGTLKIGMSLHAIQGRNIKVMGITAETVMSGSGAFQEMAKEFMNFGIFGCQETLGFSKFQKRGLNLNSKYFLEFWSKCVASGRRRGRPESGSRLSCLPELFPTVAYYSREFGRC